MKNNTYERGTQSQGEYYVTYMNLEKVIERLKTQ